MQDYARLYRKQHARNTDTQKLAEIKNILASGLEPLDMVILILLVLNPRR